MTGVINIIIVLYELILTIRLGKTDFTPLKLENNLHPYLVIIVREPLDNNLKSFNPDYVACGTVINVRWILTKASSVSTPKSKWFTVGQNRLSVPQNLENTAKNPVTKVVIKSGYNRTMQVSKDNLALLKSETPLIGIEAFVSGHVELPKSKNLTYGLKTVYWLLENKHYVKYEMNWLYHREPSRCSKHGLDYFCLTTSLEEGGTKENFGKSFPCQNNTVSEGGPILLENKLQGLYLGIDNEGTGYQKGCVMEKNTGKRTNTLRHVGVRIINEIKWIKKTIDAEITLPAPLETFHFSVNKSTLVSNRSNITRASGSRRPKTKVCKISKNEKSNCHQLLIFVSLLVLTYFC